MEESYFGKQFSEELNQQTYQSCRCQQDVHYALPAIVEQILDNIGCNEKDHGFDSHNDDLFPFFERT